MSGRPSLGGAALPSTLMRPPTARAPGGVVVEATPRVQAPLMSAHGLPTAIQVSGSRQVADKTYWLGILRDKLNATVTEVERLKKETDELRRSQAVSVGLADRASTLRREIITAEGELCDYNMLSDRLASGVTLEDLKRSWQDKDRNNTALEDEINQMYKARRELEAQIADIQARSDADAAVTALKSQVTSLETELQETRDPTIALRGKTKDELMAMVKEVTVAIGDTDRSINDAQKRITDITSAIQSLEEREQDLQGERGQQYMKLLTREREIEAFTATFESKKAQVKAELAAAQQRVLRILGESSQALEAAETLPSVDVAKAMEGELGEKERMRADAKSTADKLQAQLESRRKEMLKLDTIDQQIEQELQALKKQMADQNSELPLLGKEKLEIVRDEGEMMKKRLILERDSMKRQQKAARALAAAQQQKYLERRKLLEGTPHAKIQEAEKEMRTAAQENFASEEAIEDVRRKTSFTAVKRACLSIAEEINLLL